MSDEGRTLDHDAREFDDIAPGVTQAPDYSVREGILSYTVGLALAAGLTVASFLTVRTTQGEDIRETGSGNIGATNVARANKTLGILTLVLDAFKGWLAVVLTHVVVRAFSVGIPNPAMDLAAVATHYKLYKFC